MIVVGYKLLSLLFCLRYLNKFLIIIILCVSNAFSYYFYKHNKNQMIFERKTSNRSNTFESLALDLQRIQSGCLALRDLRPNLPLFNLTNCIEKIAINSRPDIIQDEAKVTIKFKKSNRIIDSQLNKTIYLKAENGRFSFSQEPTLLSIKIKKGQNDQFTLCSNFINVDNKWDEKKIDISKLVNEQSQNILSRNSCDEEFHGAVSSIHHVSILGNDKLLEKYGGKEYESYKNLLRMKLTSGTSTKIHYITDNSLFLWNKGNWDNGNSTHGKVVLQVKKLPSNDLSLCIWSKDGFKQFRKTVAIDQGVLSFQDDQIPFKDLVRRSLDSFSCKVDNETVILQKGDWLFNENERWKVLTSVDELENILSFDINTPLYIIEGVVERDGEEFLCSHAFNSHRTDSKQIHTPLFQEGSNRFYQTKIDSKNQYNLDETGVELSADGLSSTGSNMEDGFIAG